MATDSNILAWRIPWTEEHGRIRFIGSQRVRQEWNDLASTHIIIYSFGVCRELSIYSNLIKLLVKKLSVQVSAELKVIWSGGDRPSLRLRHLSLVLLTPVSLGLWFLQETDTWWACLVIWIVHASLIAQLVKNPPAMPETPVWSLGWEDPLEKGKATHSSILAGEVHGVAKSQTWLSVH